MGSLIFLIILGLVGAVLFLLVKQRQQKTLTRQVEMYRPFKQCEVENIVSTWLKYEGNGGIIFVLNENTIDVFSVMPTDSTAAQGCSFKILDNGIGAFDYGYLVNDTTHKQLITKLEDEVSTHKIWFLQPFNVKQLLRIEKSTIEEIDHSVNSLLLYANGKMLKFHGNTKYKESGEAIALLVAERLIAYKNGDLSPAKNTVLNEKICDIMREDHIAKNKANLKMAGKVIAATAAIGYLGRNRD